MSTPNGFYTRIPHSMHADIAPLSRDIPSPTWRFHPNLPSRTTTSKFCHIPCSAPIRFPNRQLSRFCPLSYPKTVLTCTIQFAGLLYNRIWEFAVDQTALLRARRAQFAVFLLLRACFEF